MKRRGFTMWEALIILAAIAIIAAIVIPIFARANYNMKARHCQPNLKQIGLGFAQYTQDFGEKYPPAILAQTKGGVFSEGVPTRWSTAVRSSRTSVRNSRSAR